jgi:poly(hydroxyalkanoate) depolymerase family esterase
MPSNPGVRTRTVPLRKISGTIARLAALRTQQAFSTHDAAQDRLSELSNFGSNPGALRARIYTPAILREKAPLVVVLHGCTQTAAGYDHGTGWSELADREGFALLFPEQQRSNNPHLCFNWFVPGDTKRDAGEALSIRQMIEAMVIKHDLDRKQIFITGLSAGGAMSSVMLATYPEVFASGAIIAGLPYGSAKSIPEAFDRMRGHAGPTVRQLQRSLSDATSHQGPWPTISVWHGTADHTVDASNASAIVAQWRGVHGVHAETARTSSVDGHLRRVWSDNAGRDVIEEYSISGMGHGTPLATAGDTALGTVGPFLLDVGISSTWHIARFWGIAKEPDATKTQSSSKALVTLGAPYSARRDPVAHTNADPKSAPLVNGVGRASRLPNSADRVQEIIENALRAAGLMR